ncbi:Autoinducer 2 sensor kinase/phosphatase LuxQ [Rubripirellula lacrimiformis]|uniref:Autoinducer 2 sensor kinase/phosphatase LuxQ n=1 Tax=Rubripirellula lacrimiformis TaxID=1930273 RepID=A0A517N4I4_9BACT|nr:chemotaxis protein CheB [Rubripirellula lacrimiformis]QDT02046.1 Autoinducer 2 sensor kinase/phosphatase LuxQ [Rubripirellula lacrimiformis]
MSKTDPSRLIPASPPADSDRPSDSPQDRDSRKRVRHSHHYIVGIGASAGGLEALESLFRSMPEDCGMSFVVVQHLSPDFKSHMDQLLRRVTNIQVEVVDDGVKVQPDTIYLIPPKMEMVISNGKLLLTERSPDQVLAHPIDQFLRSLAQDSGRYSIGIILSGTGSDGSRGITDIADNEGLVIAQEPTSCRFEAMPLNAQQTGRVDLVLPPEAMGEALRRFTVEGDSTESLQEQKIETIEETGLERVFQLLKQQHGIDFSHYKIGTVGRRIQRRIELLKLNGVEQYVEYINQSNAEVNDLYEDLLIGVTRFFRDPDAFATLEHQVIPDLVARADDTIRIWVCGCATGQEAYSIAMLMTEAIENSGKDIGFKMFATDAHRQSLQFASTGTYDQSHVADVSPERLERFFNKRRDGYCVNNELRGKVVFAPQNVINDPPFTQMNLVTCRNMLIYLQPPAQRKTLSLFHFALKANGVLFLGPSEAVGDISDEFDTIDGHWKIFRKRRDVRLPIELRMPLFGQTSGAMPTARPSKLGEPKTQKPTDILPEAYDVLLGKMMPPSVLVDSGLQVLHIFPGAQEFLKVPTGRLSSSLLDMIPNEIRTSVSAAIQHSLHDDKTVRYSGLPHPDGRSDTQVQLIVRPVNLPKSRTSCVLVQFEFAESVKTADSENAIRDLDFNQASVSRIEGLEQELNFSRQNLQATIEELETSNEELQATNEEMVASNEELQSTNEELHSVNEELYTVNAEHQARVVELDEANSDMTNLLATTRVGVLFLDDQLYIRRFTPEVGRLLSLDPHDLGRSIEGFTRVIGGQDFMTRIEQVLESGDEQEWEAVCRDEPYLFRALPYWSKKQTSGCVISLINIKALRKAQRDVAQFKFMADENIDAQVLIDENAQIVYANRKMGEQVGLSANELEGMSILRFGFDHNIADFRDRFEAAHASDGELFEAIHRRHDKSDYPVEVALTPISLHGQRHIFVSIRETSRRKETESEMRLLSKAVAAAAGGIIITDNRHPDRPITFVNDGFTKMTGYSESEVVGRNCRFLQGTDTDPETVAEIRRAVQGGESLRTLIQNYRKDGTPFWNDLYITPVRDDAGTVTHFVGVQNDVTERNASAELAKSNEQTIRLLLDSTAEGIFGLGADGACIFCNESAARMLGYESGDELVEQEMHSVTQPRTADGCEFPISASRILAALREGRADNVRDEVFCRCDGSVFPVEYWCHPIKQDDEVIGAVVTFVDIAERLEVEQELREAKEIADAANQAKSRFLANMSHELRTPLSAILGFTQIIREEPTDESLQENLATIQRNGDYLLRLLGDVLDLSRIESDKFQTSNSTVSLGHILGDVHATMQMRTVEYDNQLDFDLKNPLPTTVTTDAARLRQIMINLIANALKFAPKGRVNVLVDSEDVDGKVWLVVSVQDTGIGISQQKINTLFEPFVQADRSISNRFGGTGLGLSITKRLVSALGGSIGVESEQGKGSTFTFRVPIDPIGTRGTVSVQSSAESSDVASSPDVKARRVALNAKVLIADDMRDVRFVAQHFLKKADCHVEAAENGQQAVDMIVAAIEAGEPFELCLMDMQMPELDGVGAIREIRARGIELPVIALTADAMKGTRRRLIAEGFDEYLSKPLDVDRLLTAAVRLLR